MRPASYEDLLARIEEMDERLTWVDEMLLPAVREARRSLGQGVNLNAAECRYIERRLDAALAADPGASAALAEGREG